MAIAPVRPCPMLLTAAVALSCASFSARPQDADTASGSTRPAQKSAVLPLEEVVVTATAIPLTKIRSSVSVSTLNFDQIEQSAPGNAADILRNVPGILAQASGGEGNANVSARGLPQTGGAKLMQFQEDGLPVLAFGDVEFATADTFVKADYNVAKLEVIRGGSAATLASNAPGGVFNFISKTGEVAGGNLAYTRGLDYDEQRYDFDYGGPLDGRTRFHVGGFFREGEGPRSVGYTAEHGGQVKGNITREFDNGYLRLNFKWLDDRAPVYLPVPVSITGSKSDPHVASLPGFDVLDGAMQSKYFRRDLSVDRNGNPIVTDIADGYRSKSRAIGGEASFRLANDWTLDDKFRVATTSGRFFGPYPAEVGTAAQLASEIGGAGASLRYASGPLAGQAVANPALLAGNGLAVRTHLFNTTLNDFDNIANDFRLGRAFEGSWGTARLALGYFKSRQNIDMDWHWNTYLQEIKGKDSALLDVVNAAGQLVTQGGLVAYGEPLWGNCCVRSYRLRYDTDAPYVSVNWERDRLNVDASLRYDIAHASGRYAGATGTRAFDVNGDGVIEAPEQTVPIVDNTASKPVNYTKRYLSYSLGLNYVLDTHLALFGRASEGGRANATRLLFGGGVRPDGSVADQVAINKVRQLEGGAKWQSDNLALFATLFHATTRQTDQDITSVTQRFTSRTFVANGLELEGDCRIGDFRLNGGVTFTRGRIAKDQITPLEVGQRINPARVYQFTLAYQRPDYEVGLNLIGNSEMPGGSGAFALPGYTQFNAFATYRIDRHWRVALHANNLSNRIGLTEAPNAAAGVTASGVNTARSINGRTVSATLGYSFE